MIAGLCAAAAPAHASNPFKTGDLVLSVYGNGNQSGAYGDNQASPIVLRDVTTSGSFVDQLALPQASFIGASGTLNSAISGEYGSSSEGTLQLSADGHLLTIMGYGVNAASFNGATLNPTNAYGTQALAQTTSVLGGSRHRGVARRCGSERARQGRYEHRPLRLRQHEQSAQRGDGQRLVVLRRRPGCQGATARRACNSSWMAHPAAR